MKSDQAINMLNIFKSFASKTSILDDFPFFEIQQRALQDKRCRQQAQQHPDQHWQVHSLVPLLTGSSGEKLINNGDAVDSILCQDAFWLFQLLSSEDLGMRWESCSEAMELLGMYLRDSNLTVWCADSGQWEWASPAGSFWLAKPGAISGNIGS